MALKTIQNTRLADGAKINNLPEDTQGDISAIENDISTIQSEQDTQNTTISNNTTEVGKKLNNKANSGKYLEDVIASGNITVDTTDPYNPIIGVTPGIGLGDVTLDGVQTLTNKTIENGILTGSVKLPFSTSPVVNEDGKIAIDTDVTGFSHALLRFFGTEEQFLPSLPVTQLSSLSNGYVISYNAVTEEFELVAQNTPGTGDTTYINTTQIDSSAGTSSTYGLLSGAINGINTVFTVSNGAYVSGSLVVFRNGKELVQGTGEDWTQTSSASGTFTFNTAPTTGDVIDVFYNKQETTSSSLILDKDTKTVSTNYTVLPTDRNILVNASSGDITITLTTSIDSVGVHIKKIDTSGNIVTIATPGSQTIDNDSTKTIETPYYSKSIIYDGSNYFII